MLGLGLVYLSTFQLDPSNNTKVQCLMHWRYTVSRVLCKREGFRGGPLLDIQASQQLLVSSRVSGHVRGEIVPCRHCGGLDGDGHLFWDCPYPPLVAIRESLEVSSLISRDETEWPGCLLWHGWLPSLSGNMMGAPWAVNPADDMLAQLESYLGPYCQDMIDDEFDADEMSEHMPPCPKTWSDGSKIQDPV